MSRRAGSIRWPRAGSTSSSWRVKAPARPSSQLAPARPGGAAVQRVAIVAHGQIAAIGTPGRAAAGTSADGSLEEIFFAVTAPEPLGRGGTMTPPSTARVVYLIARLSARRFTNRIAALRARRAVSAGAPQPRAVRAAQRHRAQARHGAAALGLSGRHLRVSDGHGHNATGASGGAVCRAQRAAERVVIDEASYWRLRSGRPSGSPERSTSSSSASSRSSSDEPAREAREQQIRRAFREQGLEGFARASCR